MLVVANGSIGERVDRKKCSATARRARPGGKANVNQLIEVQNSYADLAAVRRAGLAEHRVLPRCLERLAV